jgi:cytochrome c biogenesis protein CcdA
LLEISFLAAFLGGVLSLLSPCSALLLPAFFAYAFASRTQLLGRTVLFLAGLITVFVPLGMGASLVAALLLDYRDTTILVAGLLLIGFGLLELTGGGFTVLPQGFLARVQGRHSAGAVYATGLVYGLAGFCSGPLLGGVLTIAGSAANPMLGGALLLTYALGTAAPLFLIAYFWEQFELGRRSWLRGRPLQLGAWSVHSNKLVAGALFILLGAGFIGFQGTSGLSGVYDDLGLAGVGFRLQSWVADHLGGQADLIALIVAVVVFAGGALIWAARRPRGRARTAEQRRHERLERTRSHTA